MRSLANPIYLQKKWGFYFRIVSKLVQGQRAGISRRCLWRDLPFLPALGKLSSKIWPTHLEMNLILFYSTGING
jgi:hypothetical protein